MDPQRLRATIAAAQAGDPEAYRALLEAYGPRLYGYFYEVTRRHHDAEDLLGELMLRLVRRLDSYDERGRFEPWLFRIAANMVRDRIRRMRASPAPVSLSADDPSGLALRDQLAGEGPPADATVVAAERADQLHAALERLDETTRKMILLRHFGHMRFKEIAEMLQCPLGTVLARVHRGLRTLRKMLEAADGPE